MLYEEDELLPLSGIQHFAFCKRQWALIHLEQQWDDNVKTVEGAILHERVHTMLPVESRGEIVVARSLPLVSHQLGLYGVADIVEFHYVNTSGPNTISFTGRTGFWSVHPVEYKRGRPKIDDRDEVQLCAQAMCLENMLGITIEDGSFFYGEPRRRTHKTLDAEIRMRVVELAREMHEAYRAGSTPPSTKMAKCKQCSLHEVCLPAVSQKHREVNAYIVSNINDQE
jgi:CRISPR-associated exonuclease Cas4